MKEKILITGATGFVGASLTENLVMEGQDVHVIVRKSSDLWRLAKVLREITIHNADLSSIMEVDDLMQRLRPEKIFHLATYGGFPGQSLWTEIVNTNIVGTFNLINAVAKTDIKALINVGSSSEYGTKAEAMKETDVLEPINTYGVTKSAACLYGRMTAVNLNKPIAAVRVFSPYGYYEDKSRLVSSVILSCLKGENPRLASGDAVRDFIFIEDTVELLKLIADSDNISGKIFNCGTGRQHSVEEVVNTVIKLTGGTVTPEWGSVPGRKSDTRKWEADMTFVKEELGWTPRYSLEEGLSRAIRWFENNKELYEKSPEDVKL